MNMNNYSNGSSCSDYSNNSDHSSRSDHSCSSCSDYSNNSDHSNSSNGNNDRNGNRRYYCLTLTVLAALSAYPLINGVRIIYVNFTNGVIEPGQYAQYVVPYAAICVALLVFAAVQPLFFITPPGESTINTTGSVPIRCMGCMQEYEERSPDGITDRPGAKLKRGVFPAGLALAFTVFFVVEHYFETIQINASGMTLIDLPFTFSESTEAAISRPALTAPGAIIAQPPTADLWQAVSCVASPDIVGPSATYEFEGSLIYVMEDNNYKIHYYFISLILITMICGLVYNLFKLRRENGLPQTTSAALPSRKTPIFLQGVSTVALVALCVFANTTAFFRQAAPIQTPLASILTGLFFVMLGATAGVYAGSFLLKKDKRIGVGAPVLLAISITILMYVGEAAMMQGALYRFGIGWFFSGLPGAAVAPVDVLIILLAGTATWLALGAARKHEDKALLLL